MIKSHRKTLVVLLFAVIITLLSGLFLRGIIIKELQHLVEAGQIIAVNRIGNLILGWSSFMAVLVFAIGFSVLRTSGESAAQSMQALGTKQDVKPEMAAPEETPPHAKKEDNRQAPKKAPARSGVTVKIVEDGQGEAEEEQFDDLGRQPHVEDPDRLKKIIKGLDELAKAEALGRALRKERIELEPYLKGIIGSARAAMGGKDVTINLECASGLIMHADPDCLAGILSNILDNAAKAVPQGGAVTLSAVVQNNEIVFSVRDTGAGIRKKDLPHIFERFYRASGNGIGLGLTIVEVLAGACNGAIEVQTSRGKGSQVSVRIPGA